MMIFKTELHYKHNLTWFQDLLQQKIHNKQKILLRKYYFKTSIPCIISQNTLFKGLQAKNSQQCNGNKSQVASSRGSSRIISR